LRLGYKGGRVEVFGYGKYKRVKVYDINSLYPTAMATTSVPLSNRGIWVKEFVPKLPGVYECSFHQTNLRVPPLFIVGQTGLYSGKGIFCSPEIDYFTREIGGNIRVERGYVFQDHGIIFKKFVDNLYQLRLDNPDSPISLMAKFILNNLYGKFAQHGEKESLVDFNSHSEYVAELVKCEQMRTNKVPENKIPSYTIYDEETSAYIRSIAGFCRWEHVGIAGMITSTSRVMLHRGLCAVKGKLLYCDTDSVHVSGSISDDLIGNQLGQFKLETGENETEGVYCGRKLYGLREKVGNEWKEKIRAKGVPVGGVNGFALDFQKLCAISGGDKVKCDYWTPDTLRTVWRKHTNPNQFRKRSRTIRKT
jgi:hypothetical protein